MVHYILAFTFVSRQFQFSLPFFCGFVGVFPHPRIRWGLAPGLGRTPAMGYNTWNGVAAGPTHLFFFQPFCMDLRISWCLGWRIEDPFPSVG